MAHTDNVRLARIVGVRFTLSAEIAEMEMPAWFRMSNRSVIVLELEEWEAVRDLRAEVDCRIEHGAESGGHLEFVRDKLDAILGAVASSGSQGGGVSDGYTHR